MAMGSTANRRRAVRSMVVLESQTELPDWQLHSLALALYLTPENACVLPASRSLSALVCLVLASFQPCLCSDTQTVLSFFHDETTAGRKTGVVSRAPARSYS